MRKKSSTSQFSQEREESVRSRTAKARQKCARVGSKRPLYKSKTEKTQEMRQMLMNHNQTLETWRKFGAVLRLYSVHGGGDFLRANVVFERKTQRCLRKEGTHHSSSSEIQPAEQNSKPFF